MGKHHRHGLGCLWRGIRELAGMVSLALAALLVAIWLGPHLFEG